MLCLDKGVERITRDAMEDVETPTAEKRHRPISHSDLARTVEVAARQRGLTIKEEQWAVSHDQQRLYGSVDFALSGAFNLPEGTGASIGIRHANDKSMAVNIIAGARVFVCANGCFVGDLEAVKRRHTAGLNLLQVVGVYLDEYLDHLGNFNGFYERMDECRISDAKAKELIHDAFLTHEVLAPKYLPAVAKRYFSSDEHREQFPDRTRWGLYNAFTEVFKTVSVPLQVNAHRTAVRSLDPLLN